MNAARRCSALFTQLSVSPKGPPTARRQLPPGVASAPAGTRFCHPGVVGAGGVKGTCTQLNSSGTTNSGATAGNVHFSVSLGSREQPYCGTSSNLFIGTHDSTPQYVIKQLFSGNNNRAEVTFFFNLDVPFVTMFF